MLAAKKETGIHKNCQENLLKRQGNSSKDAEILKNSLDVFSALKTCRCAPVFVSSLYAIGLN